MSKLADLEGAIARLGETIDAMPDIRRLRVSHDRLLAAAKCLVQTDPEEAEAAWNMLKAAIAAAEEQRHDQP